MRTQRITKYRVEKQRERNNDMQKTCKTEEEKIQLSIGIGTTDKEKKLKIKWTQY